MAGKTVVILGGGSGGLVAANRLRRTLGKEHRVVLVERSPVYSFAPSYTAVMLGRRDARRISRHLANLRRKGIEVITGDVTGLDFAGKKVQLGEQETPYDYLIIALGAEYSSAEIPGLGKAWTYYHLDGAEGLREELPRFTAGRVAVVVSALPYKCPAAPYEGALLLDDYFRRKKLRGQVEIRMFTPERQPLPVAGEAVGQAVVKLLERQEIGYTPNVKLKEIDHDAKTLRFESAVEAPFDMVIATPLHRVPPVLVAAGLAAEGGWVPVDRETLATRFEDVYAIGDVNTIPLANGMALPKAGVFAHGEAEVVSRNIAAQINEGAPVWAFGGQGACFLETSRSKAAYATGHFFAEPDPEVTLRGPSSFWHWAKIGFERLWLWRWF